MKQQDSAFNSSRNYSTTIKEKTERIVTEKENDYGYTSRFRSIAEDVTGASAIIVQDIPDGVLGRPVEFESMC